MKLMILLLSLLLLQTKKIVVLNINTNEPIQAANIYIYKDGKKVKSGYTNEKGEFYFNDLYDSINVQSIGYEDKNYSSNNYSNIIIHLKEKVSILKELIIKSEKNETILGAYKKQSSKTLVIGKEEQFGLFFKNNSTKKYKIKSLFIYLKKIPFTTDLVFNFYEIDTFKRKYSIQKTNTKTILTETIPDINKKIASFEYKLKHKYNKNIIEINLDSLDLILPKKGVFISVFTKNIYNEECKIAITSSEQLPLLYKHKTTENNFCVKLPRNDNYWQNYNLVLRFHEFIDEFHPLFPMIYYEPSIGLKIEETIE